MSLITISGPSGAGKSSVLRAILRRYPMQVSMLPSWTTRKPRNQLDEKGSYNFISIEEFHAQVKDNRFAITTCIAGNYYGTAHKDLRSATESDAVWLMDSAASTVMTLLHEGYNPLCCFVLKINKETSEQRMLIRGDERIEMQKRLEWFQTENDNCDLLLNSGIKSIEISAEPHQDTVLDVFERELSKVLHRE